MMCEILTVINTLEYILKDRAKLYETMEHNSVSSSRHRDLDSSDHGLEHPAHIPAWISFPVLGTTKCGNTYITREGDGCKGHLY
jgi:hypothetical protein